jgi:peptidyl-prolyl cis-trans isomerase C
MKRVRVLGLTLILLSVGAVSLMAAPAKKPAAAKKTVGAAAVNDSDVVLARVGNEVITRRTIAERLLEIPDQYRANYMTPEGRQQILDRVIEEKVWLNDAAAHGVPKRPEIERQLASQRRDLLIRTWINELMASNPAPSDSEAAAYYEAHAEEFRTPANVHVRHIQLKSEADAKKVLALAKAKGADWAKLVTTWSQDTLTKTNAGDLGTVTSDGGFVALGAQPALAESAMALGTGGIGGPFKTNKGWHVLKVDSYQADAVRPLDQVRSFIVRQLAQQRSTSFYQELLGRAKANSKVVTDSAAMRSYMSTRKSAREMFQDAQQAGAPQARIDAYRRLVAEWPDADITPQAAFMVGFIYSEELKDYDSAEKAFRELLAKYPKSELAASAQWMVDHMRTEEAPSFSPGEADSSAPAAAPGKGPKK